MNGRKKREVEAGREAAGSELGQCEETVYVDNGGNEVNAVSMVVKERKMGGTCSMVHVLVMVMGKTGKWW